jgi:Family of unknown function (DUF5684)
VEAVTYTTTNVNGGLIFLYVLVAYVIFVIPAWVVFTKAGQPGWAALIPIYSTYVVLKIVGRPWWWLLLIFLIPLVGLIIWFVVMLDLSKSFGHEVGFALGLFFLSLIFWYILAFGSSRYLGPAAAPGGVSPAPQTYAPAPATQPAVPPPPPPPSGGPPAPPPSAPPAEAPPMQAPPTQPPAQAPEG